MIHNPYPAPTTDDEKSTTRFQTYLSGEDKGLLFGIRPIRGTPQAVVNHLIKNLCDELRELGITNYHPDADDIFTILVERRPLSTDQLTRIRRAVAGNTKQVSTGVRDNSGGTEVRKRPSSSKTSADHPAVQAIRGVKRNSKKGTKSKAS